MTDKPAPVPSPPFDPLRLALLAPWIGLLLIGLAIQKAQEPARRCGLPHRAFGQRRRDGDALETDRRE